MSRPNTAQLALMDAQHTSTMGGQAAPLSTDRLGMGNQPLSVCRKGAMAFSSPQGAAKWPQKEHTSQKACSYGHQAPEHYFCMLCWSECYEMTK